MPDEIQPIPPVPPTPTPNVVRRLADEVGPPQPPQPEPAPSEAPPRRGEVEPPLPPTPPTPPPAPLSPQGGVGPAHPIPVTVQATTQAPKAQPEPGLSLQALRYSKTEPILPPVGGPAVTLAGQPAPTDQTGVEPTILAESGWLLGLKAASIFVGTFLIVFVLLQFPAFFSRAGFFLTHIGRKVTPATEQPGVFLPILKDRPVTLTELKDRPDRFATTDNPFLNVGDNQLFIPKINVNVPVVWESEPDEASMLASLQNGVAHYGFTALPSDGTGNVFIAGHSSYLLWDPGKFKTVFANLDRLSTGDQIAVTYQGVVYLYQVADKKVVKPTEVSVLDQTAKPTLSLMTCVPVGTNLNRLVVQADLLSKQPTKPIPLAPPALEDPASIFHYLPV